MSDKLINNPLDEPKSAQTPKQANRPQKGFNFKLSFLGKDRILSPCLLIIAMVLLTVFKIAIKVFPDKTGGYLGVVVLLTIIFFIPAYLFYKYTKRGRLSHTLRELKITPPKLNHIFLLFFGSIFIFTCTFLLSLIFRLRSSYTDGFYLYNTFFTGKLPVPDTPVFPIIAFALVPAVCEEFMFRGIFHASYEKQGFMPAALTSAVMFALISLDIRTALSNLALGLFLSFILYLTKSLVSCFIVNFLVKCLMLSFGTNLQSYVMSSSNKAVFFAFIIGALLISLAVFSLECAKIFKANAKGKYDLPKSTDKLEALKIFKSNITPISMIICGVLFIAFNILAAFT